MASSGSRRVMYAYSPEVGDFVYSESHNLKPIRDRRTNNLVWSLGLHKRMKLLQPAKATEDDMTVFHDPKYIKFIREIVPEEVATHDDEMTRYGLGQDSPVFKGVFDYSAMITGASLAGAIELNRGDSDIVINWPGGLHHAMKFGASGFCYVNDIVIAIIELMKHHARVLYVDIDVHHGDGVEKAFYGTDRCMTLSFHKWDPATFFPGTGHLNDNGDGDGKGYALNIPLDDGVNDEMFVPLFKRVVDKVIGRYLPNVIVLQCGADSLGGDKVGRWNLTTEGHGACVEHIVSHNIPLMLLGGGGYTLNNVSLCWALETAIACGDSTTSLPFHNYWHDYIKADIKMLHTTPQRNMVNKNTKAYICVLEQHMDQLLRDMSPAPSAQFKEIPDEAMQVGNDEDENAENRSPKQNIMTYA